MSRRLALAVSAAALAAACSSSPPTPSASVAVESPTPSSPPPSPVSTAAAAAGQAQSHTSDGIEATVTVLRMRRPFRVAIPVSPPQPETAGHEYAGAEVKFCLVKNVSPEKATVSWGPWSLEMADGTVAGALTSWSDDWWGVPLYPQQRPVRPGRCVRGWVPFEVSKGARLERVVYAPADGDVLEWRVR